VDKCKSIGSEIRARDPKKSPLWQCADRHHDRFEAAYPDAY
jgi:hypothetical protein